MKQVKQALFLSDYVKIEELVLVMEKNKIFSKGLNQQFLIRTKTSLAYSRKKDPKQTIELIYKGLRITKKNFCEDDIEGYLLSHEEINLLHYLASFYARLEKHERAIHILTQLVNNLDKSYINEAEKSKAYPSLIFTLTKSLGLTEQYEEARVLCLKGIDVCIKQNNMHFLPDILVNYACSLYYNDDVKEAEEQFRQAYNFYRTTKRFSFAKEVKEYIYKNFNIVIKD